MNRVEAQGRIARNLAIIRYQCESLERIGHSISAYTEAAVLGTVRTLLDQSFKNLNGAHNNFPAIDLRSGDETYGVQATLRVTKAKYDKTISAARREIGAPNSRLSRLKRMDIVGLSSVSNPTFETARLTAVHGVAVGVCTLEKLIDSANASDRQLEVLDELFQGLTSTSGWNLRSDGDEIEIFIDYLDRPAIHDSRSAEADWRAMQTAMEDIRRLIKQGADNAGQIITRPSRTFQLERRGLLDLIYAETHAISRLLQASQLAPSRAEGMLIDGHRVRVQELVNKLCDGISRPWPLW